MKTTHRLLSLALTLAAALPAVAGVNVPGVEDTWDVPTNLMPSPTSRYISDLDRNGIGDSPIVYSGTGRVLSNFELRQPSGALPPPVFGATGVGVVNFTANWEENVGGNVQQVSAMARAVISITTLETGASPTQLFDVEVLELSINGGGNLPAGMMIRESPTLASVGMNGLNLQGDGTYTGSSFFDIFTELSLDGGQSWAPSEGPCRLILEVPSGENTFATSNLPPTAPLASDREVMFSNDVAIRNVVLSGLNNSTLPPSAGGTQIVNSACKLTFALRTTPAGDYNIFTVSGTLALHVTGLFDSGNTRFFDTEMLSLDLSGDGVMLRESPTKQSLGRTSIRTTPGGASHIASFFDIFTELSLDGGQTWLPCRSGSMTFALPSSPKHEVVFINGSPLPAGPDVPADAIFTGLGNASINAHGEMAVLLKWASRTNGNGSGIALRIADQDAGGVMTSYIVARNGSPYLFPVGTSVGMLTATSPTGDPTIGEDGSVVFTAKVIETLPGGLPTKHTVTAVYTRGNPLPMIFTQTGKAVPGVPGGLWSKVSSMTPCGDGGVLIAGYMQKIEPINSTNDHVLLFFDKTGYGQLVLREGRGNIGTEMVKSIVVLYTSAKAHGKRSSNDMEVVSKVTFISGKQATVKTTVRPIR